jgi:hypothetical protein
VVLLKIKVPLEGNVKKKKKIATYLKTSLAQEQMRGWGKAISQP